MIVKKQTVMVPVGAEKETGVIGQWTPERGFGFIHQIVDGNLRTLFFHVTQIVQGVPEVGAGCSFIVGNNARGKCAATVEIQTKTSANVAPIASQSEGVVA
jgi:cold shock CspA family protein